MQTSENNYGFQPAVISHAPNQRSNTNNSQTGGAKQPTSGTGGNTNGTPSIGNGSGNIADDEATIELKKQLSQLVARYPTIQLRSTIKLLSKLDSCTKEELENMMINAQSDIAILSGTPGADIILHFMGNMGESYLPGFREELTKDVILQRDIENVLFNYTGLMGPAISIPLRTVGAATRAQKRSREQENENAAATTNANKQTKNGNGPTSPGGGQQNKEGEEGN